MRIHHTALYVNDLEAARLFFTTYLGAVSNDGYHNPRTDFRSYFLTFGSGTQLEIMQKPGMDDLQKPHNRTGYAHVAFSLGSRAAVAETASRLNHALIALGAGIAEEHTAGNTDELLHHNLSQPSLAGNTVQIRTMHQCVGLTSESIDHHRVAVSKRTGSNAGAEVHISAAFGIIQVRALTPCGIKRRTPIRRQNILFVHSTTNLHLPRLFVNAFPLQPRGAVTSSAA